MKWTVQWEFNMKRIQHEALHPEENSFLLATNLVPHRFPKYPKVSLELLESFSLHPTMWKFLRNSI